MFRAKAGRPLSLNELVRREVAETVSSPAELEEEMRHLFAVLNQ